MAETSPYAIFAGMTDALVMLGIFVAWIALQVWILPRLGVGT